MLTSISSLVYRIARAVITDRSTRTLLDYLSREIRPELLERVKFKTLFSHVIDWAGSVRGDVDPDVLVSDMVHRFMQERGAESLSGIMLRRLSERYDLMPSEARAIVDPAKDLPGDLRGGLDKYLDGMTKLIGSYLLGVFRNYGREWVKEHEGEESLEGLQEREPGKDLGPSGKALHEDIQEALEEEGRDWKVDFLEKVKSIIEYHSATPEKRKLMDAILNRRLMAEKPKKKPKKDFDVVEQTKKPETLKDIAKDFNVAEQTVLNVERSLIEKLKTSPLIKRQLEEALKGTPSEPESEEDVEDILKDKGKQESFKRYLDEHVRGSGRPGKEEGELRDPSDTTLTTLKDLADGFSVDEIVKRHPGYIKNTVQKQKNRYFDRYFRAWLETEKVASKLASWIYKGDFSMIRGADVRGPSKADIINKFKSLRVESDVSKIISDVDKLMLHPNLDVKKEYSGWGVSDFKALLGMLKSEDLETAFEKGVRKMLDADKVHFRIVVKYRADYDNEVIGKDPVKDPLNFSYESYQAVLDYDRKIGKESWMLHYVVSVDLNSDGTFKGEWKSTIEVRLGSEKVDASDLKRLLDSYVEREVISQGVIPSGYAIRYENTKTGKKIPGAQNFVDAFKWKDKTIDVSDPKHLKRLQEYDEKMKRRTLKKLGPRGPGELDIKDIHQVISLLDKEIQELKRKKEREDLTDHEEGRLKELPDEIRSLEKTISDLQHGKDVDLSEVAKSLIKDMEEQKEWLHSEQLALQKKEREEGGLKGPLTGRLKQITKEIKMVDDSIEELKKGKMASSFMRDIVVTAMCRLRVLVAEGIRLPGPVTESGKKFHAIIDKYKLSKPNPMMWLSPMDFQVLGASIKHAINDQEKKDLAEVRGKKKEDLKGKREDVLQSVEDKFEAEREVVKKLLPDMPKDYVARLEVLSKRSPESYEEFIKGKDVAWVTDERTVKRVVDNALSRFETQEVERPEPEKHVKMIELSKFQGLSKLLEGEKKRGYFLADRLRSKGSLEPAGTEEEVKDLQKQQTAMSSNVKDIIEEIKKIEGSLKGGEESKEIGDTLTKLRTESQNLSNEIIDRWKQEVSLAKVPAHALAMSIKYWISEYSILFRALASYLWFRREKVVRGYEIIEAVDAEAIRMKDAIADWTDELVEMPFEKKAEERVLELIRKIKAMIIKFVYPKKEEELPMDEEVKKIPSGLRDNVELPLKPSLTQIIWKVKDTLEEEFTKPDGDQQKVDVLIKDLKGLIEQKIEDIKDSGFAIEETFKQRSLDSLNKELKNLESMGVKKLAMSVRQVALKITAEEKSREEALIQYMVPADELKDARDIPNKLEDSDKSAIRKMAPQAREELQTLLARIVGAKKEGIPTEDLEKLKKIPEDKAKALVNNTLDLFARAMIRSYIKRWMDPAFHGKKLKHERGLLYKPFEEYAVMREYARKHIEGLSEEKEEVLELPPMGIPSTKEINEWLEKWVRLEQGKPEEMIEKFQDEFEDTSGTERGSGKRRKTRPKVIKPAPPEGTYQELKETMLGALGKTIEEGLKGNPMLLVAKILDAVSRRINTFVKHQEELGHQVPLEDAVGLLVATLREVPKLIQKLRVGPSREFQPLKGVKGPGEEKKKMRYRPQFTGAPADYVVENREEAEELAEKINLLYRTINKYIIPEEIGKSKKVAPLKEGEPPKGGYLPEKLQYPAGLHDMLESRRTALLDYPTTMSFNVALKFAGVVDPVELTETELVMR